MPEKYREELMVKGGKKLRYFSTSPIKKDYVILPKPIEKDFKSLKRWIKLAVDKIQKMCCKKSKK